MSAFIPEASSTADAATGPCPSAPHTPGPWEIAGDELDYVVARHALDDGNVVCAIPDVGMDSSRSQWPANARLIAAAPELLMVAQRSAQTFRMYEELHTAKGTPEALVKAMSNRLVAEACEAVIAKATSPDGASPRPLSRDDNATV